MSNAARPNAVRVFEDYDISAPGANADIIGTDLKPSPGTVAYRVTVALTTASVFNVVCTDGTTPHAWGLDKSTALQAGDLYAFEFAVSRANAAGTALAYNFQVETDGVIEYLAVDEIAGPAL